MEQDSLHMIDFGNSYVCKSCETPHVKVAVVAMRATAHRDFLHVVVTTLLIPIVLIIQLTAQELHTPEKRKVVFAKEDDLYKKPAPQHKRAGKVKLIKAQ